MTWGVIKFEQTVDGNAIYGDQKGRAPRLLNVSWSLLTSFMRSSSIV